MITEGPDTHHELERLMAENAGLKAKLAASRQALESVHREMDHQHRLAFEAKQDRDRLREMLAASVSIIMGEWGYGAARAVEWISEDEPDRPEHMAGALAAIAAAMKEPDKK